jgi:hypothetical protein
VLTRWTAIGTGLFCPVAVSPRNGTAGLFTRAATGELFYQERNGSIWSARHNLGVPVARSHGTELNVPVGWQLAACRGTADRIEVFASSPDGDLLHLSGVPGDWGAFACLGSPAHLAGDIGIPVGLASAPAVCSPSPGRIDVFALGHDGEVLHTSRTPEGWEGFESIGAPAVPSAASRRPVSVIEPVAACSAGNSSMAVFVRGPDGDLLLKWWNGAAWSEYASLGLPEVPDPSYPAVRIPSPLTGPPAACSWGADRIDVFARGPHGSVLHKFWDGTDWSDFHSLGLPAADDDDVVPLVSTMTACTSGPGMLDVVARGVDGRLYHAWWDGTWEHEHRGQTGV